MILKRLSIISCAASVLALTSSARAASVDEGPDATRGAPAQAEPDDVAMTAGTGIGGISGVGAVQPSLTGGLEVRLFEHLWLLGRVRSTYEEGPGYDAWGVGGALGPRVVFNPRDRIQASTFVSIGARRLFLAVPNSEFKELFGEADAGLTADIGIVSGVGLRLSSPFVQVSRRFNEQSGSAGMAEEASTNFNVGLRPEILLRVSF